ncbi:hypothetical protein EQW78_13675 [Oerskovia turbata]|uniref:Uncharacterized protein n=1 Tax=Oerskovia turbata TaxID=1713 RepID=A0A4Q1KTN7_9CELL|nr:hypothetical protein [Oerskovia turbata]RXR25280.1 hypothetical protein EQW73_10510 [Oerskovia turbata]RXR32779.1 hypothetical protein EQW78_13675 [Oerskovia turbata]
MTGLSLVALAALGALAAAALVAANAVRSRRHPRRPVLDAALRHERTTSVVAGVVALSLIVSVVSPTALPGLTGVTDTPGLLVALSPFIAVVMVLVVRAIGELAWPRPQGAVRTAPLARRTVRGLGEWRLPLFLATAALTAVALTVFGITAGEGGGTVDAPLLVTVDGWVTGSSGPYPGWPYAGPLLGVLGVITLGVLGVLRLVARRGVVRGATAQEDDSLRRLSAAHALAGTQLLVGLGSAAVMLTAALALFGADRAGAAALTFAVGSAIGITSVVVGLSVLARQALPAAPGTPPAPGTSAVTPAPQA